MQASRLEFFADQIDFDEHRRTRTGDDKVETVREGENVSFEQPVLDEMKKNKIRLKVIASEANKM